MNRKALLQIVFCLMNLCSFPSCDRKEEHRADYLIVGTNAEFPPFTFLEHKIVVGFDIDVAKAVCQRLGKKMELKDMSFEALLPSLEVGEIDFIAAGMSRTEERAKKALFTRSYITDDPLVVLTRNNMPTPVKLGDLIGKRVVVNEGYTADFYISSKIGNQCTIIRLETPAEAFLSLKNGRADAFITAKNTLQSFLTTQNKTEFHYNSIENTTEGCALVVSKKNPKLFEEIQRTLNEMEKDGTMSQLRSKWNMP